MKRNYCRNSGHTYWTPPPMSVGRAQCCPYYLVEAPRDWLDYIQFLLDPGLIIALFLSFHHYITCHVVFFQSCYMDFSKLLDEYVKIYIWISLSWYIDFSKLMNLSKLISGFLWVVTWICHYYYMGFSRWLHGFFKFVVWIS